MSNQNIILTYKNIYNLPELVYDELVDESSFSLYLKRYDFVLVTPYNLKGEFFMVRDMGKHIGWELPGGHIKEDESIEDAVNRVILSESGLEIDELEPVAIVKNNFICGNKTVSHVGLAFMALSRSQIKIPPANIQVMLTKTIPKKVAFQNDKILDLVQARLCDKEYGLPVEEIESVKEKKVSLCYAVHKFLIKPLGALSSKKIKRKILDLVGNKPVTILDASCGDSDLIDCLYKNFSPNIAIGNDISWKTISFMKDKDSHLIFTNHNVLDLPYQIKFDLIVFKNTLHHIAKEHQISLIKKLKSISKQLIIVDIDDPRNSSFLSRMWNNYYVYILDDKGDSFVRSKEFEDIVKSEFVDKECRLGTISTIKGRYFFGSISD